MDRESEKIIRFCECGCGEKINTTFRHERGYDPIPRYIIGHHMKGVVWSKERNKKVSESLKGKPKSEEHRKKLSEVRKLLFERGELVPWSKGLTKYNNKSLKMLGDKIKNNAKTNPNFGMKGKKFSLETRMKISLANRNKPHPWSSGDKNPMKRPEIAKKVSETLKGRKMTWGNKVSKTLKEKKIFAGKNNPNWGGGKIQIGCSHCGRAIFRWSPLIKKTNFCSRECMGYWMKNKKGESSFHWKGGKTERMCVVCNNKYFVYESDVKTQKFCSYKCVGKWMSQNNIGQKNPAWKGGISKEPYDFGFDRKLKDGIYNMYGKKCYHIHAPHQCRGRLTIHHIDYNKKNTTKNNFIPLCNGHNSSVNFHREKWKKHFSELIFKLSGCKEVTTPSYK